MTLTEFEKDSLEQWKRILAHYKRQISFYEETITQYSQHIKDAKTEITRIKKHCNDNFHVKLE